uniref:Uncharacterized protein n=1 Tax=Phlebotomus papatasi TaxID=29031 RepID=A0A1B0D5I4_PHLPP
MNECSKSFCEDLGGKESMDTAEMQLKLEVFTSKQMTFNNKLRDFSLQLTHKEVLHKICVENLMTEETDEKIWDYESLITQLEREQEELKGKLNREKTTATVKLAEERWKRLQ